MISQFFCFVKRLAATRKQPRPEGEGHRPDGGGEHDHKEIAQGVGGGMIGAKREQRGFEYAFE